MKRRLWAMGWLALMTCTDALASEKPEASPAKQDEEILRSVLALQCEESNPVEVVLSSRPYFPNMPRSVLLNPFEDMTGTLVPQLIQRTRNTHSLPNGIACSGIHLTDEQRIAKALTTRASPPKYPVPTGSRLPIAPGSAFSETFPTASSLLRISMPAYSASGDVAMVYTYEQCGGDCIYESYFVARYMEGHWRVIHKRKSHTWNYEASF